MIKYYVQNKTKTGIEYITQDRAWNKYLKYVQVVLYTNHVNYLMKPKKPLTFEGWLNSKEEK